VDASRASRGLVGPDRSAPRSVRDRPSSRWSLSLRESRSQPALRGDLLEVERPARLVFETLGAIGTVVLETVDGRTQMRVTIRCSSMQYLEQFIQFGVASNTDRTLDNLVRRLDRG
jgi:hypothetical protein